MRKEVHHDQRSISIFKTNIKRKRRFQIHMNLMLTTLWHEITEAQYHPFEHHLQLIKAHFTFQRLRIRLLQLNHELGRSLNRRFSKSNNLKFKGNDRRRFEIKSEMRNDLRLTWWILRFERRIIKAFDTVKRNHEANLIKRNDLSWKRRRSKQDLPSALTFWRFEKSWRRKREIKWQSTCKIEKINNDSLDKNQILRQCSKLLLKDQIRDQLMNRTNFWFMIKRVLEQISINRLKI